MISTLANLLGSSVTTPDAACPAIPTPNADPAPANNTAIAAPNNPYTTPSSPAIFIMLFPP